MLSEVLRAVIIGAPGSGKGTISERIVKYFRVLHVSSGDILRHNVAQNTDLGIKAQKFMDAGQLVPDDIVTNLLVEQIRKPPILLDGYPRTRTQAEILQKVAPINVALNLIVPMDTLMSRVAGRWVHIPSGRVYNVSFNPPRVPGFDDETGEPLVQRADDKPDAVQQRLEVYNRTIEPVLDFYYKMGILKDFHGTETNKIWPEVYKYLAKLIKPTLPFP